MINVILVAKAFSQIQQIADRRDNVSLRHGSAAIIGRRGRAEHFFRFLVFMQTSIDLNQAFTNRRFTENAALLNNIQNFFIDAHCVAMVIPAGNYNLTSALVDNVLVKENSLQPTTPAEFFGQLIPTDCCQIISFGIKKQRFHQLRGIFYCSWFSWTQTLINFKQSRIAVVGVIFASLQRCTDTGIFFEQR